MDEHLFGPQVGWTSTADKLKNVNTVKFLMFKLKRGKKWFVEF